MNGPQNGGQGMCNRKISATKSVNYLRIYCCTVLFSRHTVSLSLSFALRIRVLGSPRLPLCPGLTILQHIQAGQQESRRKVAPIDATIEGHRTDLNPLRPQSFSQLPVAPTTLLHPALYQQTRLTAPILHGFRLRLRRSGLWVKGKRTTNSLHFGKALFNWDNEGQLRSILSHLAPGCLYLFPNHLEVITHA